MFRDYFEDLRELLTEIKREFAAEHGRIFFIGFYNRFYPLLDFEFLKRASPQVMSANCDWLFKGSKTFQLFCKP